MATQKVYIRIVYRLISYFSRHNIFIRFHEEISYVLLDLETLISMR